MRDQLTAAAARQRWNELVIVEAAGVRTAAAVLVPVLLGQALSYTAWGLLIGIGGLYVALAEKQGSTLGTMLIATVAVALAAGSGAALGATVVPAALALAMLAFAGALLPVYGIVVGQIGFVATLAFAIALGLSGPGAAGLERALQFGAGGIWATALTAALWAWTRRAAPPDEADGGDPAAQAARAQWRAALRSSLRPDSPAFGHALRVAVAATAALLIGRALGVENGTWITVTALVVMKVDLPATRQRAGQRLLGTVVGGGCALLLAAAIHSLIVLDTLLVLSSVLAFSHLTGSYRRYMIFLTIFIVLLRDSAMPGSWQLALFRIATTFAGIVLALIVAYTLRSRDQTVGAAGAVL